MPLWRVWANSRPQGAERMWRSQLSESACGRYRDVDLFDWISGLIDVVIYFVRGYYWSIFLITGLLLLAMYAAAH
jgi:hypothetical protein